jgi:multidrug efflux pump subunit AcrA (membrane-fusion protein)
MNPMIFLSTLLLFSCHKTPEPLKDAPIPDVYVESIHKVELSSTILMGGWIRTQNERYLRSQVAGVVGRVFFKPGVDLTKGQVVFSIIPDSQGHEYRAHPVASEISGRFLRLLVKEGDRITPGDSLGLVGDPKVLVIDSQATYGDLQTLKKPGRIQILIPGISDKPLAQAKLAFVEPSADSKTGTFGVSFEFQGLDPQVKPGMLAQIRLESHIRQAVLLEEKAIYRRDKENYALVLDPKTQKAIKKPLTLGLDQGGNKTEILGGLMGGEQVIMYFSKPVQDGDTVRVVTREKASP